MATINLLDKKVYNRISAGEVVERPASIVKELVENSLDAGASQIEISIEKGGIAAITVRDNGGGIERSQLNKAFLPHATSKISRAEDLDNIMTLGFRGEALASIGAVTKASIVSKPENQQIGAKIDCDGGELKQTEDFPSLTGTTVSCRDLFYNTPAREKFLKSPKSEEAEINNVVTRLALANPGVSFKLEADGKSLVSTYGGGLKECVACVYGVKTLEKCFQIESVKNGIKVYGFVGKLDFTKPTRAYQTLIVNGRYVIDGTVSSAVQNAYGSYLMKRQYPFYVLNLEVPPEAVDVNVHPRKEEVRFSNNQVIYSAVYSVVSKVLDGTKEAIEIIKDDGSGVSYGERSTQTPTAAPTEENSQKTAYNAVNGSFASEIPKNNYAESSPMTHFEKGETENSAEHKEMAPQPEAERGVSDVPYSADVNRPTADAVREAYLAARKKGFNYASDGKPQLNVFDSAYAPEEDSSLSGEDIFAENKKYIEKLEREKRLAQAKTEQARIEIEENLSFVGQAFDTYLIFTKGDDMYLIDQHAAHERLLFDEFCEKVRQNKVQTQTLLIPYNFYVAEKDYESIYSRLDYFREIGIEIDAISDTGFSVSAIPADLCDIDLKKFFDDLLFDNEFKRESVPLTLKEKLMQNACKHAIKGGDRLDRSEIDALMAKIDGNFGLKCPHGRPIAVKVSRTELEKWFKRIV